MSYTITLADGTELKDVSLNGNNYISSDKEIGNALTPVNLTSVAISDGDITEHHENMVLDNLWTQGDGTHFLIRDMTPAELEQARIKANMEYLAMMMDVEL